MATGNVPRGFPRILQWLLAGLMLIIGLAIGILGAKLASVGGTWYFAIMGLVMVIASLLIFRNRRGGIVLYAVAFAASIVGLSATPAGPTGRCSHACLRLAFWLFCAPLFGLFFSAHRQKKARPSPSRACWPWHCWSVLVGCLNPSRWSAPAKRCR